jgi:hypothetical protein
MRVGIYIFQEKKQKMNWDNIVNYLRDYNIELVDINNANMNEHYDFIITKFDEFYRENIVNREFEALFCEKNVKSNSLYSQKKICDRLHMTTTLFKNINKYFNCYDLFAPKFIEYEDGIITNLNFPLICKPINAFGTHDAHKMAIIKNQKSLHKLKIVGGSILQEFHNHDGIIYKVYVVGDHYDVICKESVKNINPEDDFEVTYFNNTNFKTDSPDFSKLIDITKKIDFKLLNTYMRSLFAVDLFGYDVLKLSGCDKYAIIDVNYFPGYAGMANFNSNFASYITQSCKKLY